MCRLTLLFFFALDRIKVSIIKDNSHRRHRLSRRYPAPLRLIIIVTAGSAEVMLPRLSLSLPLASSVLTLFFLPFSFFSKSNRSPYSQAPNSIDIVFNYSTQNHLQTSVGMWAHFLLMNLKGLKAEQQCWWALASDLCNCMRAFFVSIKIEVLFYYLSYFPNWIRVCAVKRQIQLTMRSITLHCIFCEQVLFLFLSSKRRERDFIDAIPPLAETYAQFLIDGLERVESEIALLMSFGKWFVQLHACLRLVLSFSGMIQFLVCLPRAGLF